MPVAFPPSILGLEMAAPILSPPWLFWFFLLQSSMPIKFLVLGGELWVFEWEGEGAEGPTEMWGRLFPELLHEPKESCLVHLSAMVYLSATVQSDAAPRETRRDY